MGPLNALRPWTDDTFGKADIGCSDHLSVSGCPCRSPMPTPLE